MNHARPTIYYNVGFQLASHAGVLLTQLAYVVMVTRALDLDSFGRFSLAAGVVQMVLMISDLGLNVLIVREMASSPTSQTAFGQLDRKSTRLNSSHITISYAVFCLK